MDDKHNHHVFPPILRSLSKASKTLQISPVLSILFNRTHSKPAIEAFLILGAEAVTLTSSSKPFLFKLAQSLDDLEAESERLEKLRGYNLVAVLYRRIVGLRISRIVRSIGLDIGLFEDRAMIERLVSALTRDSERDDEDKIEVLVEFRMRLSRGFDGEFQELVLKGRVFHALELVLIGGQRRSWSSQYSVYNSTSSQERIRDEAAMAILALVEFNKDVFVGPVLMGPTTQVLVSAGTCPMLRVLCSLVEQVKTLMVDHIESIGEIPNIVMLCGSKDVQVGLAAADVVIEMALYGSRETVETMVVEEGLVKKLVELQRVVEKEEGYNMNTECRSLVARLAVEVSAGEGLERRERRELRSEIMRLIGECCVSKSEHASIVSEVLWDSFSQH